MAQNLLDFGAEHVPARPYCRRHTLPVNLPKFHSQDLPSFAYATKRYSSSSDHQLFFLVREHLSSLSLKHPWLSLLGSRPLSLELSFLIQLDGWLLGEARGLLSLAPKSWVHLVLFSRATASTAAAYSFQSMRAGLMHTCLRKSKE